MEMIHREQFLGENNMWISRKLTQYNSRVFLLLLIDVFVINIVSYVSLWVRFDFSFQNIETQFMEHLGNVFILYTLMTLLIFAGCRLYRSVWTFASIREIWHVLVAVTIAIAAQLIMMSILRYTMPRSFYFIEYTLLFIGTTSVRFSVRGYRLLRSLFEQKPKVEQERIMIVGAGQAGQVLIKEYKTSTYLDAQICCAIDDNPKKRGKFICGVPIVGNRDCILEQVEQHNIDKIIVALPSASIQARRDILQICQMTQCEIQMVPGLYQIINGEVNIAKLRKVKIEDLLGRDSIKVNLDEIMGYVTDKTILITGGGGSIGSELCRQIATYHPKKLIIFDIYENNAYDIQQELKRRYPQLNLFVLIGSVRNKHRIEQVIREYRPDIIYHAAAHKHVPLMEDSPNEAIKNNVFGTYNTAEAAAKYQVKRFVLISTDKAVNPTNIMGASKRLCEMIVQSFDRRAKTEFVAVRFGNVLGSNGSVIPLFKKQIEKGGPVTVTHPDIIRYFMTIPEAVSLVLQAGAYANGGEIFILDMGEPVRIVDLARNLIRLSGYIPDEDIEILYTGLRPGEKLYEELLLNEEGLQDTQNKMIHIGKPIEIEHNFEEKLKKLQIACYEDVDDIKELVEEMVPTYVRAKDTKLKLVRKAI